MGGYVAFCDCSIVLAFHDDRSVLPRDAACDQCHAMVKVGIIAATVNGENSMAVAFIPEEVRPMGG